MSNSIRVLVVDDSPLLRRMITDLLNETSDIEVVGTAEDGQQALDLLDQLAPDVVTLDIQMPKLNGLETLQAMLARRPVPVVMVSAMTRLGANTTLECLERGAIDYAAKPEGPLKQLGPFGDELVKKIRIAAATNMQSLLEKRALRYQRRLSRNPPLPRSTAHLVDAAIAIGISTGGPPALAEMLPQLVAPLPPILIVQHMPAMFTKTFADRLASLCSLKVKEAEPNDCLVPNHIYIAPGGRHMEVLKSEGEYKLIIRNGEAVSGHKPSIDVLMRSVARSFGSRALGVIMTGMGRDGAAGCAAIRHAGGYVLGQDEVTSDVYGMNKAAMLEGNVDQPFALDDGAEIIQSYVRNTWSPRRSVMA